MHGTIPSALRQQVEAGKSHLQKEIGIVELTTRQRDGVTIADVAGKLTADGGAVVFRKETTALLARGLRGIILYLEGVDAIDSSGIGELVAANEAAKAVGGRIVLLGVGRVIQRALETAGVLGQFAVYSDETSAVASFGR
jgi:anti-anti-sigma factor